MEELSFLIDLNNPANHNILILFEIIDFDVIKPVKLSIFSLYPDYEKVFIECASEVIENFDSSQIVELDDDNDEGSWLFYKNNIGEDTVYCSPNIMDKEDCNKIETKKILFYNGYYGYVLGTNEKEVIKNCAEHIQVRNRNLKRRKISEYEYYMNIIGMVKEKLSMTDEFIEQQKKALGKYYIPPLVTLIMSNVK